MHNYIILQESIHSFETKVTCLGYMILKLDLKKAYDWVEWDFAIQILEHLRLPQLWINIISACITTPNMAINWNRNPTNSFASSRGLCQGDLMPPLFFVLFLERLVHLICDPVHQERWKPFSFGRGSGVKISHLFFADDIILVAKANYQQVQEINRIISLCYCFWVNCKPE